MRISWTDIDRVLGFGALFAAGVIRSNGGDWHFMALAGIAMLLNGVMNSVSAMRVEITVDGETVDSSEAS